MKHICLGDARGQEVNTIRKITPFMWFDDKVEEAAKYNVSVFRN